MDALGLFTDPHQSPTGRVPIYVSNVVFAPGNAIAYPIGGSLFALFITYISLSNTGACLGICPSIFKKNTGTVYCQCWISSNGPYPISAQFTAGTDSIVNATGGTAYAILYAFE